MQAKQGLVILLLTAVFLFALLTVFLRPTAEGEARRPVQQVLVTNIEFEGSKAAQSQQISVRLSSVLQKGVPQPNGRVIRFLSFDGYGSVSGRLSVTFFIPGSLIAKAEAQRVQLLGYKKSWNSAQTALVKTTSEGYTYKAFPVPADAYAIVVKEIPKKTGPAAV